MESIFLKRPRPLDGECLTSYIQRVAKDNFITPNDIWRICKIDDTSYPQTPSSFLLDIAPELIFDIRKFEQMVLLDKQQTKELTFKNVIKNLLTIDVSNSEVYSLNKFLSRNRKFCPLCLKDSLYYKLIWQVNEVKTCNIHNIDLINKCAYCHKTIPSMPPNGMIGICPHCHHSILEGTISSNSDNLYTRIYEDWFYLIQTDYPSTIIQDNLSLIQHLALKILYITRYNTGIPHRKLYLNLAKEKTTITIQQCIRLILNTLRSINLSIEPFITCTPDTEYINSILYGKMSILTKDSKYIWFKYFL